MTYSKTKMTELEYWAKEYPELDVEEIAEILAIIEEECDASQTVTSDDP